MICCEWNPAAVEALRRNVRLNRVEDRVQIRVGDCRQVCPQAVANRVQMGLIPSSLHCLDVACRALNPVTRTPLYLHIHENVNYREWVPETDMDRTTKVAIGRQRWSQKVVDAVRRTIAQVHPQVQWQVEAAEVNLVKPYAPHIDHLVADIRCSQEVLSLGKQT